MQTRFRRNPQLYESFLDIMQMYKNDHKSVKELHQTVCVLLMNHFSFNFFLQNFSFNFGNVILTLIIIGLLQVISIFQGHQDLVDEFTHFLP